MSVTESEIVSAIRGFKMAVALREADEIKLMAERYLQVERALDAQIEALAQQIAVLHAQGKDPTWSAIYRLERWQSLQIQLMEELAGFNSWAAKLIEGEQYTLGMLAIDNAAEALAKAGPQLQTTLRLHRLPHDAVQGMVGAARDGSPLGALLATSYPQMRDVMTRELVKSVALGRNPRLTAALIRKATGLGLNRALTIARTEQLRAYREASLAAYRAMGVRRVQRICTLDERTCIGCLVVDGEILDSEAEFDEHPMGRCDVVPYLEDFGLEQNERMVGKDWFLGQPPETQLAMMGPGRYEAWSSGQADWRDLATRRDDPTWGGSWVPTPLRDLPLSAPEEMAA